MSLILLASAAGLAASSTVGDASEDATQALPRATDAARTATDAAGHTAGWCVGAAPATGCESTITVSGRSTLRIVPAPGFHGDITAVVTDALDQAFRLTCAFDAVSTNAWGDASGQGRCTSSGGDLEPGPATVRATATPDSMGAYTVGVYKDDGSDAWLRTASILLGADAGVETDAVTAGSEPLRAEVRDASAATPGVADPRATPSAADPHASDGNSSAGGPGDTVADAIGSADSLGTGAFLVIRDGALVTDAHDQHLDSRAPPLPTERDGARQANYDTPATPFLALWLGTNADLSAGPTLWGASAQFGAPGDDGREPVHLGPHGTPESASHNFMPSATGSGPTLDAPKVGHASDDGPDTHAGGSGSAGVATTAPHTSAALPSNGRAAALAGVALSALPLLAWALYHRIRGHATLDNATRKAIYDGVCEKPGAGVRELAKRAGVSYSTAAYHLNRLVDAGMVVLCQEGNKLRYYKNGGAFTETERRLLPLLENREAMRVLQAILDKPGTYRAEIAERLGVTATTVNWHLKGLVAEGLVRETRQGRRCVLEADRKRLARVVVPVLEKLEARADTTVPLPPRVASAIKANAAAHA